MHFPLTGHDFSAPLFSFTAMIIYNLHSLSEIHAATCAMVPDLIKVTDCIEYGAILLVEKPHVQKSKFEDRKERLKDEFRIPRFNQPDRLLRQEINST